MKNPLNVFPIALILFLIPLYSLTSPKDVYDWEDVSSTLRTIESGGQPNHGIDAVGDGGAAIGPFQIHRAYHADAVEYAAQHDIPFGLVIGGTPDYSRCSSEDMYSEFIVTLYAQRYSGKAYTRLLSGEGTLRDCEVVIRKHNGGPKGLAKASTLDYWHKAAPLL